MTGSRSSLEEPPQRESVAELARDTGISPEAIDNWRHQGPKPGQRMPVPTTSPEQWIAASKLGSVIRSPGLNGPELGRFCRERGTVPKQVARWRQASQDVKASSAPNMADQRDLQRKYQELVRQNKRLERELQKKEKALTEAETLLMLSKKFNQIFQRDNKDQ